MTAREALIIGGGIGGPVAAMALQRAGIKVTIYEAWDHPAEGGLLVGADGIHSATRQLLVPGSPEPAYTGLIGVGGYSRSTTIPPTPNTQHFVFGRRAFFGYLVRESAEMWWFANLARPQKPSGQELAAISSQQWKRHLLELFAGDLPLIGEIIGSTGSDIGAHVVEDLATTPVWRRGPVVLIGDAAHAASSNAGQGASLAMEDALMLASCLRDFPDMERAVAAYERLRRQRAEKIVAYSHRIGRSKTTSNPLGVWIRDLVMPRAQALRQPRRARLNLHLPRQLGRARAAAAPATCARSHLKGPAMTTILPLRSVSRDRSS
jgi:FAD-dependent urate hydroxylase